MDAVAVRAGTSKRSLYAHFENKDKLFAAAMDLSGELYLSRLRTPDAYADEPTEAVTLFCGRFLQLMVWENSVRTCRLSIAEAARLPESANALYDGLFVASAERLSAYLDEHFGRGALAEDLLNRSALPRVFRTLLNVDEPLKAEPEASALAEHVDLDAIRQVVATALS
jgi:AcrR family transcriptional regulator